jgi:four helix bundle protein
LKQILLKNQLLRATFSVSANYSTVCRARTDAAFYSKISGVVEEADELARIVKRIQNNKKSTSEGLFERGK